MSISEMLLEHYQNRRRGRKNQRWLVRSRLRSSLKDKLLYSRRRGKGDHVRATGFVQAEIKNLRSEMQAETINMVPCRNRRLRSDKSSLRLPDVVSVVQVAYLHGTDQRTQLSKERSASLVGYNSTLEAGSRCLPEKRAETIAIAFKALSGLLSLATWDTQFATSSILSGLREKIRSMKSSSAAQITGTGVSGDELHVRRRAQCLPD